jgi:hypothetical protein
VRGLFFVSPMSAFDVTRFNCPNCAASYQLVHFQAEDTSSDCEITCLQCDVVSLKSLGA